MDTSSSWRFTCDAYEQMLYKICDINKEEIDRIFLLNRDKNMKYMGRADCLSISIGESENITQLQKIDVIIGRMRETPQKRISREQIEIMDTYERVSSVKEKKEKTFEANMPMEAIREQMKIKEKQSQMAGYCVELPSDMKSDIAQNMYRQKLSSVDGIRSAEEMVRDFYAINGPVRKDETICKAVKKMRRRAMKFLFPDEEKKEREDLFEAFLCAAIINFNQNITADETSKRKTANYTCFLPTPFGADADRIVWPFLYYSGMSRWRIGFLEDGKWFERYVSISRRGVDRVLYSYILYMLVEEAELRRKRLKEDAEYRKDKAGRTDIQFLFKKVSDLDYSGVITACLFAAAQEIERDARKESTYKKLLAESQKDPEEELRGRDAFRREIRKLKEKAAALEEALGKEKEKNRDLSKNEWDRKNAEARIDSISKENLKKERELTEVIKDKDEEIRMLREQLENASEMIDKEAALASVNDKDAPVPEADTDERYLFICSHEVCAQRIRDTFPNSHTTEDYVLTPKNALTFKAVICITPSIPHVLYYKIKNICRAAGVQFLNCNTINVDSIKRFLAEQGFSRYTGKDSQ